ncbi:alkaline shock response membrane anchor protein AmaP [Blastococcus sp. TBT05-19]|uniref:alkaline shock response membrane anchor protein AmaP n=1 Tax=Blastococcus sp. TBT05-19 TaxID=2250581 RepID=UPI000DEBEEBF|nr:alkaline shock response membrane anchor protein AmaP [Blastococcus sp. TBT05-19]RBY91666.1 alkaline shock response membrane anchor protein AmaP [Blastococcus sp. TBT05-19]
MSARTDSVNRSVLTLLALLLLAAGGVGLATSFGAFGSAPDVLPQGLRDFAADQWWFWLVAGAVCLLIALLALRWLLAQLSTDRVGQVDLTSDERDGRTVVHSGAIADAVENEAEALRGVSSASAHLRDERGRRLSVTVDLTDYADIAEVRRILEERVVGHARQALDDPSLPVDIELRPGRSRSGGRGLL